MASPTITGTHASDTIDGAPITPFSGVTVTDPTPGATETLTFFSIGLGAGTLADGADYTGPHTLTDPEGEYQITGTAAQVTQELDALVFTAGERAPGSSATFSIGIQDITSANEYAADTGTEVTNTTPPDVVTLSPQVTYRNGVFTLTGNATSAVGVTNVDIQAIADGTPTDLGTTTVDANGDFTFADRIGPHTQTYITAIETDTDYYTPARDTATISLTGGLRQGAVRAEEDVYTPDGSAVAAVSHFERDGLHLTDVLTSGQTLSADYTDTFNDNYQGDNTFVYNAGHGSNVVTEFRLEGPQHDTLSFAGSDFDNSIAAVLANAYGPGDGSGVVIVDPVTQDTVQLAGITKRGLVANQDDIAFHA